MGEHHKNTVPNSHDTACFFLWTWCNSLGKVSKKPKKNSGPFNQKKNSSFNCISKGDFECGTDVGNLTLKRMAKMSPQLHKESFLWLSMCCASFMVQLLLPTGLVNEMTTVIS